MQEDASEQQETKFFDQLPLLYSGNVTQERVLKSVDISVEAFLDEVLEPFVDRLITPGRDDLMAVTFVGAFLSDVSSWCAHRKEYAVPAHNSGNNGGNRILWQCIPGYFSLIRLYLSIFQLMCQRRPRMTAMPPAPNSVGRILSIVEGQHSGSSASADVDPWLTYWSGREVEIVLEAASEVLKNEYLANVFVKIVLESTNMHDPVSVNYSFGILQRVLEIAAKSASARSTAASEPLANGSNGSTDKAANGKVARSGRHYRLSDKFDDEYFIGVMRRALKSVHVQILLKVLTCLYNSIGACLGTHRANFIPHHQFLDMSCGG